MFVAGGTMRKFPGPRSRVVVVLASASCLLFSACGGGGSEEPAGKTGAPVAGKRGGKLVELWTDDVDYIDPGQAYYQPSYQVMSATQRFLMSYKPDDSTTPVPDLAEA